MGFECWCSAAQRMALLVGKIVGVRQAEILEVVDCEVSGCSQRGASDCLVGHEIEGRW